jgi:hypothetical protein
MIRLTLKGPLIVDNDCVAVETWEVPDGRAKVWFDGRKRVCKLAVDEATLDLELTPGVTSVPIIRRLIEEHGGDSEKWRAAALDAAWPQLRSRGRPKTGLTLATLTLAIAVFFEVERLRYLKAADPLFQVARNRCKSKERIRQLCVIGRRSISVK